MQPSHCLCPYCSAKLRIRDRALLGKPIDCPECGGQVVILADRRGELSAQKMATPADAEDSPSWRNRIAATWEKLQESPWLASGLALLKSPVGFAWSVAVGTAVLLLAAIWVPAGDEGPPRAVSAETDSAATSDSRKKSSSPKKEPDVAKPPSSSSPNTAADDGEEITQQAKPSEQPAVAEPPRAPSQERPSVPKQPPKKAAGDVSHNPAIAMKPQTQTGPPKSVTAKRSLSQADIEAALAQPIRHFEQSTPVALERMLFQLEEMTGLPMRYNQMKDNASETLQKPVSVELHGTTVGGILQDVLEKAGLAYEARPTGIHILPGKTHH